MEPPFLRFLYVVVYHIIAREGRRYNDRKGAAPSVKQVEKWYAQ